MDTILQKIRGLLEVEEVKGGIDSKTLFTRIEIDFSKNDIKTWEASGTDNVEIKVSGDYIAKELYGGNQGNASFKLGSQHSRELKFSETRKAYGKFNKIYVSNRFKECGTGDTTGKVVFLVGYLIGGEVEPADSGKDSILDIAGAVINPAKEDGNLATIAGLDGVDGGGDLQKVKEELELIKTATQIMDDWDDTDRCKVSLTAATEQKLTDIETALQIIDDWDLSDRCKVVLPTVSSATNSKVAVGNTDTQVIVSNASRKFAVFVNDSNEVIYLSLSATAVINEGIRLNAGGGAYEINQTNLYTGEVSAICATGGKNLTFSHG